MNEVLVLNAGSSSLKFALIDPGSGRRHLSGIAERLGTADAAVTTRRNDDAATITLPRGEHADAIAAVFEAAGIGTDPGTDIAVGHRVVHGGEHFTSSVLIDDEVVAAIQQVSKLAPLHNPAALAGIDAVRAIAPHARQVAVFDTAFHQTMPERSYRYAVPEKWYRDYGIRRYGFHGTSHRYVSARAAELLGRAADPTLALVVAHLGNGASAAAVLGGRSVDTTMGLTPLEGLVMGTRSGDVDPGLFGYLTDQHAMTTADVTLALNTASGLLGLSGSSNDMRTLTSAAAAGDRAAGLAVDIFVHRLAKAVAALVVPLGRLDAVVFTGGIGENSALIRARVVAALGFLGLRLDDAANAEHGRHRGGLISLAPSAASGEAAPVAMVVPTDEELLIARDTAALVQDRTPR